MGTAAFGCPASPKGKRPRASLVGTDAFVRPAKAEPDPSHAEKTL